MLAGRELLAGELKRVVLLASLLLMLGTTLAGLFVLGPDWTTHERLVRVFTVGPTFYPALTPITLLLMAAALFLVPAFVSLGSRIAFEPRNFMVCLGRSSLSFLILHVVVMRESAAYFGFWHAFSAAGTLLSTLAVLAVCSVLAVVWRRFDFRFGAEWLLRRVAG
jgi:uncharacterized membrane protein YeiB